MEVLLNTALILSKNVREAEGRHKALEPLDSFPNLSILYIFDYLTVEMASLILRG
jgi:hypothetical protein